MPKHDPLGEKDFLRLFLKHEQALRAFARSFLPDWNSVDDVLQEASLVMWEKWSALQDDAGFLPWGKTIVRFKCLSHVQKIRSEKFVFSEALLNLLADEAEAMPETPLRAQRDALACCMKQFSEPEKDLLLAPYVAHGRITELAATQARSVNALYKKLGRLRDRLARCVQARLGGSVS